ncbi:30S ribosomal protein S20 [bacterium]|nr:30S ribosomal protein S20 [bacterium]
MAKPLGALSKRDLQALARRERGRAAKSRLRSAVRAAREATAAGAKDAPAKVKSACWLAQRTASKGIIHKNRAARVASRLMAGLNRSLATSSSA